MGWLAAGGAPSSPFLGYLVTIFAVWQIPHLWLISLTSAGDDGRGVYGFAAGLGTRGTTRLVFLWVFCLGVLMMFAPLFGAVTSPSASALVFANACVLVVFFMSATLGRRVRRSGFALLNGSAGFHVAVIAASNVLGRL